MTPISVPAATGMTAGRDLLLTPDEAVGLIRSGDRVAVGGSGSLLQVPETLLSALEARHSRTSAPRDLDVIHVMGLGDQQGRGIDHIAVDGLVRRFIGSHFVLSPRQQQMIADGRVEAIGLPAGTITQLYRETAARRPGLFTDIGLETFVDPRQQWGRMNDATTEGLSRIERIDGQDWLFYPRLHVDVALLRGTEADEHGNVSMDEEAAASDNLAIAQAAHNSGGVVVVEVARIVPAGTIPAGRVRIPGALVDHVVLREWHHQTPLTLDDPRRSGVVVNAPTTIDAIPLDARKVVARRAVMEIHRGDLVNLGVGMANGISSVALEEGLLDGFSISIEQGVFGGIPGVGLDSGTSVNPSAIVDMPGQFDLYDGGALDVAGLAFAQIDAVGDVNVASVGGIPIGPGGFIDISQKARTVLFCGTLRGGGLETALDASSGLSIGRDGRYAKFVERVERVTFSADRARRTGQRVLYVTERAVFELGEHGPELTEVAPGVDVERDVIGRMGFRPRIRADLRTMDLRLFGDGPLGLALRAQRRRPTRTKGMTR